MPTRPFALVALAAGLFPNPASAGPPRWVRPDDAAGTSAAVVVAAEAGLAHTGQILPVDGDGKAVAPGRAGEQAGAVIAGLERALAARGSGLDDLVKVDVYVKNLDALAAFRAAFARTMAGTKGRPAVTHVVTPLSDPDALVGLDAVAVAGATGAGRPPRSAVPVAVLPAGPRVFISGQADPDADTAGAARKTLAGLDGTLKHLGLDRSRVVRVKAFMNAVSPESAAAVTREVGRFFGEAGAPPTTLVEWRSGANAPIEIELVAAAAAVEKAPNAPAVEYLTPPALKASPVFSRVVRVNSGPLIYVSGLVGQADTPAPAQVEAIFGALASVLAEAGGDFRHLVKATYYVTDDPASRALNDLRPRYYDPARPPAASKAVVAGVGAEGRTVGVDMIAAPRPTP